MKATPDIEGVVSRRLTPFRPAVVYLFGSTAKGCSRPDSDVDIAFLASSPPDPVRVFDVAQEIASDLGREVDLVDLHRASAVLKAQVIGTGRRLPGGDPGATATFEMYALSDYARANEERREPLRVFEESFHAR